MFDQIYIIVLHILQDKRKNDLKWSSLIAEEGTFAKKYTLK